MNKLLLILLSIMILVNCNSSDKQEATTGPKEHTEESVVTSRSDTIEIEFSIEGMTEAMDMYLLKSPEEFPLDFSTYIPVDMRAETVRSDEGNAIRIWAVFGGNTNKNAYLIIYAFPSEVDAEEARKTAVEKAKTLGDITEDAKRHPWADAVYSLKGDRMGFLALAKEKDRWFYLLAAYPPEYADGMGPRIHQVIEKWRWRDSGASLRD